MEYWLLEEILHSQLGSIIQVLFTQKINQKYQNMLDTNNGKRFTARILLDTLGFQGLTKQVFIQLFFTLKIYGRL